MNNKKIDIKKIIKDGGATLNHKGQPIEKNIGYMVSLYGKEFTTTKEQEAQKKVCEYLEMIKENKKVFVGVWVDAGVVYVDLSIHILDYNEALETGRENKQKAIFDLKTKKSLYLTYKKYYTMYKIIRNKDNKIIDYKLIIQSEKKEKLKKALNIKKENTLKNIIYKDLQQFEKRKKHFKNYIIVSDTITLEELNL